jgi:fructosamine-3-kinase
MWQAISHLLSEQLGEGEIELRNELPGGEIHAAWHLRYAGRDLFVKCDERELLPIFTAEADQLELLSRSKTVTVRRSGRGQRPRLQFPGHGISPRPPAGCP